MTINKNKVLKVLKYTVLVLLALTSIFVVLMVINGIGYNPELGFHDTRVYWWNVGEYMETGKIHYTYSNLNLAEIIGRFFA